jgi:crotonobetainyl-CoA:carnitine CoA-transferase CaiB-like acyl-CoA transferase
VEVQNVSDDLPGPLAGVRVLEIGELPGEYCGLTLAGLGAEVVRVEPPEGSGTRRLGPFVNDHPDIERSLHFWAYNRGKRSVVADLGSATGRERFRRLLGVADVLVDSTTRGLLATSGFGDDVLDAEFPRLVAARITPFGDDGPWADWTGSDLVHLALGGPLLNCGYDPRPDGVYDLPPMAPQLLQSFHITGEQVAFGIAAALVDRFRSGRGQHLRCAVHQAVATNTETDLMGWVVQRQPYLRQTARHAGPEIKPDFPLAQTKDGRWLHVISIGARDRNLLRPFLQRYGLGDNLPAEQAAEETGARQIPGTTSGSSDNVAIIQRLTRRFTFAELPWREMQDAGLLCAPVRKPHENALDDHWLARGTYRTVEHPELGGRFPYPVSKWIATRSAWQVGRRAPLLGEDTEALSTDWTPRPAPSAAYASPRAAQPPADHGRPAALAGVRIFDFSWFLASAGGTRSLAALGADVIKVEWKANPDTRGGGFPAGGREARRSATGPLPAVPVGPMGPQFNNKNPGKRGISLNVRDPRGREIAEEFIRRSDVVAEGFSPGVFSRWGFSWERLQELNPGIIYAQQSGMGAQGTYGRFRAVGPIAGSLSSMTEMGGLPEPAPPSGWGYSYLDWLGAYSFTLAITSALYQREVTGHGQWIDASQTEVGLLTTGVPLLDWAVNGRTWQRNANRSVYGNAAPEGVYPCSGDDRWIAVSCTDDTHWHALADLAGHPEWTRDPRFATPAARIAHHDALDELISGWTRDTDRYATMTALQQAGVPAGVAQTTQDRCDIDPQLAHLNWLTEVPNPSVGTWPVAALPFTLSATPPHVGGRIGKGAPVYGEHNYEVYAEVLGLSSDEVDALSADGVV